MEEITMIELSLNNIQMYYGANEVLTDVSFQLKSGERIGLIGKNGTGKTTLFKIISGKESPYAGDVFFRKGSTVGYLDQIPVYKDATVQEVLNLGLGELNNINKELRLLEQKMADVSEDYDKVLAKYGETQLRFEHLGGYEIEERMSKVIAGFKFDANFLDMDFELLSGGEKTKVMLAKLLLEEPSILLLDEPTNHLDIDTVEWLEGFLNDYKGSVVIISHDRYFLDSTVTRIMELINKKSVEFVGNYSYYVEEKERRLIQQIKEYEHQQKKIKSMEEAIKRFRDWGSRADNEFMFKKAKSMEKRIERMDKVDRPKTNEKKIKLAFDSGDRSGKEVVKAENVYKAFDAKEVLKDVNFKLFYTDKVALLGPNGTGKSTLFNMILEKFAPDQGKVDVGASVSIGYLEQEITFEEENKSMLQTFVEDAMVTEEEARRKLARFLFYGDDVYKELKNLSGGEKARFKLCQMMESQVNLLLLDEPTNHVDIDSREMIEQALASFDGTVLFISHDRYFIRKIASKVFAIENGAISEYWGDYDHYKHELDKKTVALTQLAERVSSGKKEKKEYKNKAILSSEEKEMKKRQKRADSLEGEIAKIEITIEELKSEMNTNSSDVQALISLQLEMDEAKKKHESMMEEWMTLIG